MNWDNFYNSIVGKKVKVAVPDFMKLSMDGAPMRFKGQKEEFYVYEITRAQDVSELEEMYGVRTPGPTKWLYTLRTKDGETIENVPERFIEKAPEKIKVGQLWKGAYTKKARALVQWVSEEEDEVTYANTTSRNSHSCSLDTFREMYKLEHDV